MTSEVFHVERFSPRRRALLTVVIGVALGIVLAIVTAPTPGPVVDPSFNPDTAVPYVSTPEGAQP